MSERARQSERGSILNLSECEIRALFFLAVFELRTSGIMVERAGVLPTVQKREPAVAAACKMCNGCVVILIM